MSFRKIWPSIACFSSALIAYLTYLFIGVKVDENGFLKEAFFLLPLSLSFIMLGSVLLVVFFILKLKAGEKFRFSR